MTRPVLAQAAAGVAAPSGTAPASGSVQPVITNDRVFGVLPNYRTGNLKDPYRPLSAKKKYYIGYKDSTDYPLFVLGGVLAGFGQLVNQHPDFHQGLKGYAHRYVTSTADQLIGNMLTESIMPSLLRQDPRYFRMGEGSGKSRFVYAATRIFVAKNDKGKWGFNYSEVLGNTASAAIGNLYYPHERSLIDNFQRVYSQLATDALSQVFKEFWPDIHQAMHRKKTAAIAPPH
ncbi:MAG: hypothetical protein ABI824_02290 [Acidobacteriota bacterium]